MRLDRSVTDAVFAAAAAETYWVDTNLGPTANVTVKGVEYTVDVHYSGRHLASVSYASEWGNTTAVQGAHASQEQHRAVVLAATRALGHWVRR